MKTAYLDCFSGISGDMLLGALLDIGLPESVVEETIAALPVKGCSLAVSKTTECTIAATRVRIKAAADQPHRNLADIEKIILTASLPEPVQTKALEVFRLLAEAEAAVHGTGVDEIHFHEVGAIDALVDVVGVVSGFHSLGINRIRCSPLPVPRGWVECTHGTLPVPAPAVCRLLEGKPVYGVELAQELVTPTGAALMHVLAGDFGQLPPMHLEQTGYGAGSAQRSDGRPNLLRIITGVVHDPDEAQIVEVIETALDDWNPETWPHVTELFFQHGALDVLLVPVHMKKGRPGFLLTIVCEPSRSRDLQRIVFAETSSIGLRCHREERVTLPRESITVSTRFGPVAAKKIATPAGTVITPEFESCRRIALKRNIPIRDIYREVERCCSTGE